jgi:phosphotransferase system  glucose/maltose/N-acetylglucosamine-specific IIC component
MRLWKVLALLAGVAGVIGFFTPLIEYRSSDGKLTGDASAFQIARGVDSVGDIASEGQTLGLSRDDSERIAKIFHEGLNAYRGVAIAYFAPAGLLALLGILLLLRDRMGRFSGLIAMLLGGACGAVFAMFWQADQTSRDASASLGLGLYLLLAAGLGGVLAGLGALVSPDHGPDVGLE